MITVEIPEKDIYAELPSDWHELTTDQFATVIKNWIKLVDQKISLDEFRLIVLYDFLGIKRSPFQGWKDKRLTAVDIQEKFFNLWQLCETLNWIFREVEMDGEKVIVLSYTGVINMMPQIETVQYEFIGPADGLLDITFSEYRYAWKYFLSYSHNRKHDDLDMMVAVLYRPERTDYNLIRLTPSFDGHRREAFNPNLTAHYAEICKAIPYWQKYAVYHWFGNCDRWIKEDELELDGKMISFAPLFANQKSEEEDLSENDLGLTSLLFSLAESNLFGTMENADKANYIDVLTALLYWKQQIDKIKRK